MSQSQINAMSHPVKAELLRRELEKERKKGSNIILKIQKIFTASSRSQKPNPLYDVPLVQPNPSPSSPTSGHLDNVTKQMWPTISNLLNATSLLIDSQRKMENLQEVIKKTTHKKNTVLPNDMEKTIQETIRVHSARMKEVQKAKHALTTNKTARFQAIAQTENAYRMFMSLNDQATNNIENPEKLKKIHRDMKDNYAKINKLVGARTYNPSNYVDRPKTNTTFNKADLEAKLKNIERTLTAPSTPPRKTGGAPCRAKKTA